MNTVEDWLLTHEGEGIAFIDAFCRIASVSADPAFSDDMVRAADFVAAGLRAAGFPVVEKINTGGHPFVFAEWIVDPAAPTILVYGHYDVQPPDPLDKWLTPPFQPDIRNGRLYARGASDDKGPLSVAIFVARAFNETERGPPLNIKFLVEGEEESGSPHFAPTVSRIKDRLACDLVVSADGAMWRSDLPSVTVASRGLVALDVHVEGGAKDLHSGRHGGSAPNAARALVHMLATLHDKDGTITVPGFADGIIRPDPAIEETIRTVDFAPDVYFDSIGAEHPVPLPSGPELLRRQWLIPTIEFNGISSGYSGSGTKTVIPSSAFAKITCRLVAGQDPEHALAALESHLRLVVPTGYRLVLVRHGAGSAAFSLDPGLPGLAIAEEVLAEVLGARPVRVAMGATIPIGEVFARHLGVATVFFSFSTADEDYHAPNEFFRISSFRSGLRAWARLMERMARDLQ